MDDEQACVRCRSGVGHTWFSTITDGAARHLAPRSAYLAVLLSERLRSDPLRCAQIDSEIAAQRGTGRHRNVMVLHSCRAQPHVNLSVRAEGRDGQRLNPRRKDLRLWREVFAQRLRARGIEAEATPQSTRGAWHRTERVRERKSKRQPARTAGANPMRMQMSPSLIRAGEACVRIAQALATSTQTSDREFGQAVLRYVREMPVVKTLLDRSTAERELPAISRTIVTPMRSDPEIER